MKKFIIAASLLATTIISANAQDETMAGAGFKPVKGDVTAEVGLIGGNGFIPSSELSSTSGQPVDKSGTPFFGVPTGVLRFRYFLADQLAVRVGLNLYKTTTKTEFPSTTTTPAPAGPAPISGSEKTSMSQTLINLGIEKHFSGTERLSTYAGADLLILMRGTKRTGENVATPGGTPANGASYEIKNANGTTAFGLRLVTGADYYFVKKVYLGIELGWGFLAGKEKDTESKSNPGSGTAGSSTDKGSKTFDLMPSATGALRLGFRF